MTSPFELADEAAGALAERTGVESHDVAVVLGSGWRPAAERFGDVVAEVPLTDLPGFPAATVAGHVGAVRSIVAPGGRRVLAFLGRAHARDGQADSDLVVFRQRATRRHVATTTAAERVHLITAHVIITPLSADPRHRPSQGAPMSLTATTHLNFHGDARAALESLVPSAVAVPAGLALTACSAESDGSGATTKDGVTTLSLWTHNGGNEVELALNKRVINEFNASHDDIEVELRDIHQHREWARELASVRGRQTVPVLRIETPDGAVQFMGESRDIIQYLGSLA